MSAAPSIVVTGLGLVCPLGIGRAAVAENLAAGRGGVRRIQSFDTTHLPIKLAGEIEGFDASRFVSPRKALKVMARDAQLAMAAASLACDDARIAAGTVDPERFGALFGGHIIRNPIEEVSLPFRACLENGEFHFDRWGDAGLRACFPLNLLKLLPNMLGSHVSIAHDARGPNNTLCMGDVSGLVAMAEAADVMRRGWVDAMIVGGSCSRINVYDLLRLAVGGEPSTADDPLRGCRPFDVDRGGEVRGEAAAAMIFETRSAAEARGAPCLAEVAGWGSAGGGRADLGARHADPLRRAVRKALAAARIEPRAVGAVFAHGLGTRTGDAAEAQALRDVLPDVPVFAAKGYLGNSEAACGAVEAALAVAALVEGRIAPTLGCDMVDPRCPIPVVRGRPLTSFAPTIVVVGYTGCGQAAAVVLRKA